MDVIESSRPHSCEFHFILTITGPRSSIQLQQPEIPTSHMLDDCSKFQSLKLSPHLAVQNIVNEPQPQLTWYQHLILAYCY